jgi:hypothetical protein
VYPPSAVKLYLLHFCPKVTLENASLTYCNSVSCCEY